MMMKGRIALAAIFLFAVLAGVSHQQTSDGPDFHFFQPIAQDEVTLVQAAGLAANQQFCGVTGHLATFYDGEDYPTNLANYIAGAVSVDSAVRYRCGSACNENDLLIFEDDSCFIADCNFDITVGQPDLTQDYCLVTTGDGSGNAFMGSCTPADSRDGYIVEYDVYPGNINPGLSQFTVPGGYGITANGASSVAYYHPNGLFYLSDAYVEPSSTDFTIQNSLFAFSIDAAGLSTNEVVQFEFLDSDFTYQIQKTAASQLTVSSAQQTFSGFNFVGPFVGVIVENREHRVRLWFYDDGATTPIFTHRNINNETRITNEVNSAIPYDVECETLYGGVFSDPDPNGNPNFCTGLNEGLLRISVSGVNPANPARISPVTILQRFTTGSTDCIQYGDFSLTVRACGFTPAQIAGANVATYDFVRNNTAAGNQQSTSADFNANIAFGSFVADGASLGDPTCDASDMYLADFVSAVPTGLGGFYQFADLPGVNVFYDYEDPRCFTRGAITIEIEGEGNPYTPQLVDGGSIDNCTPQDQLVFEYDPPTIQCINGGPNPFTVIQTVTDCTGNQASCPILVTILDEQPPTLTCADNITIEFTINTFIELPTSAFTQDPTFDNCGTPEIFPSKQIFTCADLGPNEITVLARDGSGNEARCTMFVFVEDTGLLCQPEIFFWERKLFVNESEALGPDDLKSVVARVGYELTATFYADWFFRNDFVEIGQAPCKFDNFFFFFEGDDFYGDFIPEPAASWSLDSDFNNGNPTPGTTWHIAEQSTQGTYTLTSPSVLVGGPFFVEMNYYLTTRTGIVVTIEGLDENGVWQQLGNPVPVNNNQPFTFTNVFRYFGDFDLIESQARVRYEIPDASQLGNPSVLFEGLYVDSFFIRTQYAICIFNFTDLGLSSPEFGDGKNIAPAEDFVDTIQFSVTAPGLELAGIVQSDLIIFDLPPEWTGTFNDVTINEGQFLSSTSVPDPVLFDDPIGDIDQIFLFLADWFETGTPVLVPLDQQLDVNDPANYFPISPVYPDGPATFDVPLFIRDKDGLETDPPAIIRVTVNNVAPTWIDGPFDVSVVSGNVIPGANFGTLLFTDPADTFDTYTVEIDYGTGAFVPAGTFLSGVPFTLPDSPIIVAGPFETSRTGIACVDDGDVAIEERPCIQFNINIGNQAASLSPGFLSTYTINEGNALLSAATGVQTFTGVPELNQYEVYVAWNGVGNGPDTLVATINSGESFSLPDSPIIQDGPATFTPAVFILDTNGDVAFSTTFVVNVLNVAPTIAASTPSLNFDMISGAVPAFTINLSDPADENDAPFVAQFRFPNANSAWVTGDFTQNVGLVSFDFDLSLFPVDTYVFQIRVIDKDNGISNILEYNINVENSAPLIIQAPVARTFNEGERYPGGDIVAWSDTGVFNTYTVTIQYGSGSATTLEYDDSLNRAVLPPGPTFTDGPDTIVATITVTDSEGGSDTHLWTITVLNVAPQITGFTPATVSTNEGSTVSNLALSFVDPGADTLIITVDWFGNGQNVQNIPVSGSSIAVPASPVLPNGPATLNSRFTITDSDGASSFIIIPVYVNNVAPTIPNSFVPPSQKSVTYNIGSVPFTDPGLNDIITATINFGDGVAPTPGVVSRTAGSASGTITFDQHTYCGSGDRTIVITISDGATTTTAVYPVTGNAVCPAVQCQTATCRARTGTSGCTYRNVNSPIVCNDNNPCTINDRCNSSGQCLPGTPVANCVP